MVLMEYMVTIHIFLLKSFQKSNGLKVDGIAGSQTLAAIGLQF